MTEDIKHGWRDHYYRMLPDDKVRTCRCGKRETKLHLYTTVAVAWIIMIAIGFVILSILVSVASERGPECSSEAACEMYEPPDDFGVP